MPESTDQFKAAWDAERYDRQFGFVSSLADGLLDLLDPQQGETIVDLGCGTGELAVRIRDAGSRVIAIDSDPAMVEAAMRRLGSDVRLADGHNFTVPEPVDAVFSNAALHWMTRPSEVLRSVRAALRNGGRFVGELGGAQNVAGIIAALRAALAEHNLADRFRVPWYFPTPDEYAGLLRSNGFRVARMEYFPRPTELTDCPNGLADWVRMFGNTMIDHVTTEVLPAVLERINELAAPTLSRDGRWYADYYRLRFVAIADAASASPSEGIR
jgi:trans-aconitate methyltransferase